MFGGSHQWSPPEAAGCIAKDNVELLALHPSAPASPHCPPSPVLVQILTVSPNYATEIMSGADKGVELNRYLAEKGVEGIVNGMDVEEWDPASDKLLTVKYDKVRVTRRMCEGSCEAGSCTLCRHAVHKGGKNVSWWWQRQDARTF